jgi:hypothetical protein
MSTQQLLDSASNNNNNSTTMGPNGEAAPNQEKKIKGTYKRIEEWDAERKASGELSWEERVQYEGQRYGNGVRQNDILQKNLRAF